MEKTFDKTFQSAEFGVEFAMSVVVATMTILLRVQSLTDWQVQSGRPREVVSWPEWVNQVKILFLLFLSGM